MDQAKIRGSKKEFPPEIPEECLFVPAQYRKFGSHPVFSFVTPPEASWMYTSLHTDFSFKQILHWPSGVFATHSLFLVNAGEHPDPADYLSSHPGHGPWVGSGVLTSLVQTNSGFWPAQQ